MKDKLKEALTESIYDAISGEGPFALFQSGGLDSAVIQAVARIDHPYCVTWPEQDNHSTATLAAQGKPLRHVTFTRSQMMDALPEVARITSGTGSWSQVCQWFAARQAAADGCKTVITGEGADELFAGYSRYRILHYFDLMRTDPKLRDYEGIINHMIGKPRETVSRLLARSMGGDAPAAVEAHGQGKTCVELAKSVDFELLKARALKNQTLCIEAHGLKVRYPFMDARVIEVARQIRPEYLVTQWENKAILRDVGRDVGVHEFILDERNKKGLFIPQAWRPDGTPEWSSTWFNEAMGKAWREVK